jgi:ribosomal protein L12E/L44/L45/RPP1/RPP2
MAMTTIQVSNRCDTQFAHAISTRNSAAAAAVAAAAAAAAAAEAGTRERETKKMCTQ